MKADGSLKSLLQGVSQQPTRDRLAGQCTEQVNMSADPVKGLTRRPGDDLVGWMGEADARNWSKLQTQDGRQFLVKITDAGPVVFDFNANSYPVNIVGVNPTYWSTPGRWSVTTIRRKTYLANKSVVTAMATAVRNYPNYGAGQFPSGIIQILGGNYGRVYSITLNGTVVASYRTRNGSGANDASTVGTARIATVLYYLLTLPAGTPLPPDVANSAENPVGTGAMSTPDWQVIQKEDIIYVRRLVANAPQFTLSISDDTANVNAKAMTNSVPDVADLPRLAPHDYVVRQAAETDPEQDLWLRFISDDIGAIPGGSFGVTGAWYETVAPGIPTSFEPSTMPKVMVWDPFTGIFTVTEEDWADRTVGTEITNPTPSFIGYGITDVTSFQNRLVFLGGPNLIASRTKRYENFWVGSASALVDSDPLDFTSQAAFSTSFEYAIPHNKDLVVFSTKGQFILFGRAAVTPKNAAIVLTSSFESDLVARPSACGRNVFFSTKYGRFTGVREFFTEGGTDINDTRPITQHVKNYIVGAAQHLSSTSNYDTLLVHTDTDKQKVYPYQFIWNDAEKVQSAWSTWTFPTNIEFSFFDEELIYFIQRVNTSYFLLRMSLDVLSEDGTDYHVHLSNRFDVTGVNTQFVLPYNWLSNEELIAVQGEGCPNPGLPVRVISVVWSQAEQGFVATLRNDMQGGSIVVGIPFMSEYWPTMPRMKDADGVVISNARLMISQFILSLEDTGHIVGQKISKYGNGPEVPFEGYIINSPQAIVGRPALDEYTFKMPFREKAEIAEVKFSTDTHWPATILDIEWEGTVNKRGKRLSTGA